MLHEHRSITQVGSPDPELRNSPIAVEEDIDTDVVRQQEPGAAVCWFNGTEFRNGDLVASGSQVLRCSYGVWVDAGSTIDDRSP
jgi:hypothetical protein